MDFGDDSRVLLRLAVQRSELPLREVCAAILDEFAHRPASVQQQILRDYHSAHGAPAKESLPLPFRCL